MSRLAFSDGDQRFHESAEKCDAFDCDKHTPVVVSVAEGFSDECACGENGECWTVGEDG